jgi:tetratricopeptide (TPR) repeat protein
MPWFRGATFALVLVAAACGDDDSENVRGVQVAPTPGQPVDTATKAPPVAEIPSPTADASPDADADTPGDAAPQPAPAHPPGWLEALRHLGQGRHLVSQEQPAAAVKAFQAARDAVPDEGWLHAELARTCLAANDSACAIAASSAALEKANGQAALEAMAHLLQGNAQKAAGNIEAAKAAYRQSVAVSPSQAVVEMLAELSAPDAGTIEPPEDVTCQPAAAEGDPFVANVSGRSEARDAAVCPIIGRAFEDPESDGRAAQVNVVALLERSRDVDEIMADQGGLSAQGAFPLLLVRLGGEEPEVVVLSDGRERERQDEILGEITGDIRRITLGPSRPGLVVEVTTRGWWNVGSRATPFPFERTEIFLVSRQLAELTLLARQVTYESGHEPSVDCLFGNVSRAVSRRGAMWLEDLDLSGVPEICQETREQVSLRPDWAGGGVEARTSASCQQWVASALQGVARPVPSLRLDEAELERARHEVLDVSRVPTSLRINVRPLVRENEVVLASKSLELTLSGTRAIALMANDTQVRVATSNAGDSTTSLDIGPVGRWQELWGSINSNNPTLIQIEITARGSLDGATERRWLHLIRTTPGELPVHVFQAEVYTEQPMDTDPCPSIIAASQARETRNDALFITLNRTQRFGPGVRALDSARSGTCHYVQVWNTDLDAGPALDAGIPELAATTCPIRTERLESDRYAQGSDGRFARTTLP